MKRPMKPHVDGFEDEEDCEGYFDPDEQERRRCPVWSSHTARPDDPCRMCIDKYHAKKDAERKAEWDAKTPEEKAEHKAFLKGLRGLY